MTNKCCNLNSSIIIPKCFNVDSTVFKIDNSDKICFYYTNLDTHNKIHKVNIKTHYGYYIIDLDTSSNINNNTICIEKFFIEVRCLSKINNCVNIVNFGNLVHSK